MEIVQPIPTRAKITCAWLGHAHSFDRCVDLEYYPFAFQKFGVIQICQVIDGKEYPYPTLELNGANGRKDLFRYHRFLEVSGSLLNHRPSMIHPS